MRHNLCIGTRNTEGYCYVRCETCSLTQWDFKFISNSRRQGLPIYRTCATFSNEPHHAAVPSHRHTPYPKSSTNALSQVIVYIRHIPRPVLTPLIEPFHENPPCVVFPPRKLPIVTSSSRRSFRVVMPTKWEILVKEIVHAHRHHD